MNIFREEPIQFLPYYMKYYTFNIFNLLYADMKIKGYTLCASIQRFSVDNEDNLFFTVDELFGYSEEQEQTILSMSKVGFGTIDARDCDFSSPNEEILFNLLKNRKNEQKVLGDLEIEKYITFPLFQNVFFSEKNHLWFGIPLFLSKEFKDKMIPCGILSLHVVGNFSPSDSIVSEFESVARALQEDERYVLVDNIFSLSNAINFAHLVNISLFKFDSYYRSFVRSTTALISHNYSKLRSDLES